MENNYKLMRESFIALDISEFSYSRSLNEFHHFGGEEMVKAYWHSFQEYKSLQFSIEIKCVRWLDDSDILFHAKMFSHLEHRIEKSVCIYFEFPLVIKKGRGGNIFFKNMVLPDELLNDSVLLSYMIENDLITDELYRKEILSRKLFMKPYGDDFKPARLHDMTYYSKRKSYEPENSYPPEDEIDFAHLYWQKRFMEQRKAYRHMRFLGKKIPPRYQADIRARNEAKLGFSLR